MTIYKLYNCRWYRTIFPCPSPTLFLHPGTRIWSPTVGRWVNELWTSWTQWKTNKADPLSVILNHSFMLLIAMLGLLICRYFFNCYPRPLLFFSSSRCCDNILRVLGPISRPATALPVRPGLGPLQNSQRMVVPIRRNPLLRIMVSGSPSVCELNRPLSVRHSQWPNGNEEGTTNTIRDVPDHTTPSIPPPWSTKIGHCFWAAVSPLV